jgi:hypothetical protein
LPDEDFTTASEDPYGREYYLNYQALPY